VKRSRRTGLTAGSGVPIHLDGRVAVVTGGSRGIGRACVETLAAAGARVVFSYRRHAEAARAVERGVARAGGTAVAVRADVARPSGGPALVRAALRRFGSADILVNNAGIWEPPEGRRLERMSAAQWRRTMAVNLDGVFHCTRAVIPAMKRRRWGRIVTISSTAAQRGEDLHADYAASKGALVSFTKSLAVELGPWGILVNSVAPWWVYTDMSRGVLDRQARDGSLSDGETSPLGRVAQPGEIAGPVLFLCSDLATYVTGEILNVNGGTILCG
jgi:3-oxoacyl-[acyl-carrier protein] reductase